MMEFGIGVFLASAFSVAVHWNGFFKENRDPDLLRSARERNEVYFIGGIIGAVAAIVWLFGVLVVSALRG